MNHLNTEQKYCIASLLSEGKNQTEIVEIIGFHKSTISRELPRNSEKSYNYKRADALAKERHKHIRSYKLTLPISRYIKSGLNRRINQSKLPYTLNENSESPIPRNVFQVAFET